MGGIFLDVTVAVPTALSLNSSSQIDLYNHPKQQSINYREKCRLLIKDERDEDRNKKYLLVCKGDNTSGVDFYYSYEVEPEKFNKLEGEVERKTNEPKKVKVKLEGQGQNTVDMTVSSGDWTDLMNKSLG